VLRHGHHQCQHDLERHDEDEEEQRVAPRVAEVHVGEHALEVVETQAVALRHHREEERLDHRNHDQEREERDGREEECERQESLRARPHHLSSPFLLLAHFTWQAPVDVPSGPQHLMLPSVMIF